MSAEILAQQADEREALFSIYEGDTAFKSDPNNLTTYQYKYGDEDSTKSFMVEINWGEQYPNEMPDINMDIFYNRNLIPAVKERIKQALHEEAEQWLGCGMTYSLFECLKDRLEELTVDQPDHVTSVDLDSGVSAIKISDSSATTETSQKKEPKKEHLTKSQKRRQWENTDRPRGWNWVDIIKHLSQTGSKDNQNTSVSNDSTSSASAATQILQPLNS